MVRKATFEKVNLKSKVNSYLLRRKVGVMSLKLYLAKEKFVPFLKKCIEIIIKMNYLLKLCTLAV